MTDKLEELRARERAALAAVQQVKEEIRALLVSRCRVCVGQVVRGTRDKREYRVVEITRPEYGWVVAVPKRADGSWGVQRRNLFDNFEVIG